MSGANTPMLTHWREVKAAHPDALIFYRLGDFYELFFEDAEVAAPALDIALTSRAKGPEGPGAPMCGVPVRTAESYLARLVRQGFRVAICEQVEDPKNRAPGRKGALERRVTRVITPGTVTEEALLDARRARHLAALAQSRGRFGLAWADISTGRLAAAPAEGLADAVCLLARIDPDELLVPEGFCDDPDWALMTADWSARIARLADARFQPAADRLAERFRAATLDGFGAFTPAEVAALSALADYVGATQMEGAPRLSPPLRETAEAQMRIDPATRRNLELFTALDGGRKGGLLAAVDRTATAPGARLLADRIAAPSTDPALIAGRQDAVDWFVQHVSARGAVRDALKRCPDMERALARLSANRAGPRDLAALRDGLGAAAGLRHAMRAADDPGDALTGADALARALGDLGEFSAFIDRLDRALAPEPPLAVSDGGFIATGYDLALDELRTLGEDSRRHIAALETRYREETGLSLKVKQNNVLGYFLELPAAKGEALIGREGFIHRQTTASALRFTTVELGDLEGRIAGATDKALALEKQHFADLAQDALARAADIARAAAALAEIDVAAGFAELAEIRRYVRPKVDGSLHFAVTGGRHPVVEQALDAGGFAPNDLALDGEARVWLVTGPNMAGKSTFLRQNALIAILAQAGGFVPADTAHLGVVDRLFSRVGAADDLARGRSTFMVEMVETAAILNQAGPRSFVILDEIGRGTATWDGLSIAWAVLEHLDAVNASRGLFATHYHELTALADQRPALSAHRMLVKEWKGEIAFLRQVAPGAAERSYGVHVARLAGLPAVAVERAEQVLAQLENGEATAPRRVVEDLPLFAAAAPKAEAPPSPALAALRAVDPDELTPRAALEALYRLKALDVA